MITLTALSCLSPAQRAAAEAVDRSEELNLAVGENKTLPASDVKSYSEGAPGVVEVKVTPSGSQFVIVGQRPGSTTLLLILRDGREVTWTIHVFARPIKVVESELGELLGDLTGIRVRRVGSRFFVEGGVSTEAELERIKHIAGLYQGQVESLVVLGGAAADRKINIRVDFFFVQYNKTHSQQIGMAWPGAIGGDGIVRSSFVYDFLGGGALRTAQASVIDHPLPRLDLAMRNGWAKVLRHATVLTSNGAQAEFASGGNQSFAVAAGLTSTIQKITFGTTLKVLPRFDPSSREMQVTVDADVADLTPPLTAGTDLPGQNTSKLNTGVALKLGQSIVLSGVRSETMRSSKVGLPWLSQIPVLGLLFGSKSQEREDVEGAIFIVPSVVERIPQRTLELMDDALGQFENFSGDMDDVAPFVERPVLPAPIPAASPASAPGVAP
jgi:pilus assembly protein CpaC